MIACAYTPGPYADLARECVAAWKEYGVDVYAVEYPDGGSWHRNVLGFNVAVAPLWASGPLYVIGVDSLPGPRFVGLPEFNGADVVCEYRPSCQWNMKIHSGIVGWADNQLARKWHARFIEMLKAEMGLPPYRNDQEVLYGLLIDMERAGGNWRRLPHGYNSKTGGPNAEMVHGHVSRRLKDA